jgi:regulator of RNase E activity RraB
MPSEYWRSYYSARLCFAKKKYEKAEKLLCTLLSTSSKNFNENMDEYIKCKYRLGKDEETLYIIENLKEQGYEPSAGVRAIETYLNAEKYRKYELPYRIKQVRDYDREFAIHYTTERFEQEDNLTTLNNDDIRLLFSRAEKAIANCEGKADGLYDKYLCYYKKVGKERGKENKESLNYLEVVTVPDTKEIIFAYPKIGVNEPLRKNNYQNEKVLAKKCKYIGVCDKK